MSKPEWVDDFSNDKLPSGDFEAAFAKCSVAQLAPGQRIGWWYEDDAECMQECDLLADPPFSGIVVPGPGYEARGPMLEIEDTVVVIDRYPTEKCYPEVEYVAMRRLLDARDLVRVIPAPAEEEKPGGDDED